MKPNTTLDRLPPHSTEAEQGVLGCCLIDPSQCLPETAADIAAESFYDLRHQSIYETLTQMMDAGKPVDLIGAMQHLKDRNLLDQIGGYGYLSQLQDAVPSAANLNSYLTTVKEKHLLRRAIKVTSEFTANIRDYEGEPNVAIDELEAKTLALRTSSQTAKTSQQMVNASVNIIERMFERQGALGGISTGLPDLDQLTDGMHGKEMIVIAALHKVGKTALAMNIADNVAVEQKLPVGVFSLEMGADQLMLRMICSRAHVNLRNIRDGIISEGDMPRLTAAAGALGTAPIHCDDEAGLTIQQIRSRARRMIQQHGIKLFIIDYLQLIHTAKSRGNREQDVAEISHGVKAMAKELNVPVIILSQVNKDGNTRESMAIEQDLDQKWLLSKDEDADLNAETVAVNLSVPLNRSGPTGKIALTLLKGYTKFEQAARITEAEANEARYKD